MRQELFCVLGVLCGPERSCAAPSKHARVPVGLTAIKALRAGKTYDACSACLTSSDHTGEPAMPEPIIAWQCIGCGKLEAPQTCIGVCEDRKVELLPAHHHAEAIAQLDDARNALAQWHNLAHRLLDRKSTRLNSSH